MIPRPIKGRFLDSIGSDNVVYLLHYMHHLLLMVNSITVMLILMLFMQILLYSILLTHYKYDLVNSTVKTFTIFDISFVRKLVSHLLKIRQLQGDFAPLTPHQGLCLAKPPGLTLPRAPLRAVVLLP